MAAMDTSQPSTSDAPNLPPSQPECLNDLANFSARTSDEKTKLEITTYYLSNLVQLARTPCNDLLKRIQSLPIDTIEHLRKELAIQFLSHHKIQDSFSIKPNSSAKTLSKDIYTITQLSVQPTFSETDLLLVFKKTNRSPCYVDEDDLEVIFTAIQELQIDSKRTHNQINSLIDLVKLQSARIDSLQSENNSLKLIIQNNNAILKQIQSKINVNDFPNLLNNGTNTPRNTIPSTPLQNSTSYSQAVALPKKPTNKRPSTDSPTKSTRNKSQKTDDVTTPNTKASQSSESVTRQTSRPNGESNIRQFDSSNPYEPTKSIEDNEFKLAGPRKRTKNSSIHNYIKTSGKGENTGFKSCERKVDIYLGRISIDETLENVKSVVNEIVQTKIKDKNIWPRGAVVGRYRKPYSERNQNTQSSSEAKMSYTPNQSNTNQ
ncbi:unnamed protein product [Brachionus calyciflorus]|uniref:Uncharacterized protein n=1 Tax=Brachionus calyciflorus TaxID=104777 RepID=A0A814INZ0_9BILA|nr:unnamed protein product [Brachionus calyciflorus]